MNISYEFLMERVMEDGDCLLWTGSRDERNIPKLTVRQPALRNTKTIQPRRAMWEAAKGPIPPKRYVSVCCGNRLCLNPDHLVLRTRGQIVSEVAKRPDTQRRRHLGGLKSRERSVLDMEKVRAMRATEGTNAAVAQMFGCAETTASAIRRHKRWKDYSSPFAGLAG